MKTVKDVNVVPFTVDTALSDVQKLNLLIDGLLELGTKINANSIQLKNVQDQLRMQELKNNFYTIAEVAEAMHCTPKSAMNELRARGIEIITSGKTYVVQKDNFLNAFKNEVVNV